MAQQPLSIVVLGGSYAGLSVAHHIFDNIIRHLSTFEGAPTYRVVLVSPSTHLYWNICAPRALVSPNLINLDHVFVPIEPARHPLNKFTLIQGWATEVDTGARKVKIESVKNGSTKRFSRISKASSSTAAPEPPTVSPVSNTDYRSHTMDQHIKTQTIPYHALIIATGSSSDSPLFTLHGTHEETLTELRDFHRKLESAHSVLIVGGGPSGVETAGQLATYYSRRNRWRNLSTGRHGPTSSTDSHALARAHRVLFPSHDKRDSIISQKVIVPRERELERRKRDSDMSSHSTAPPPTIQITPLGPTAPRAPKTIILLSGGARVLPKLPHAVSKKAEKKLKKLGVHIIHNLRELGHTTKEGGDLTDCHLNNDMTITSDLLISATGVYPNTRFLSKPMLDEAGYILTDRKTLRVYSASIGDRIYAIGDCASYSRNCLLDVYEALPVLTKNLHNDLMAHEYRLQTLQAVSYPETLAKLFSGSARRVGFCKSDRWEYEPLSRSTTSPPREHSEPESGDEQRLGRTSATPAAPTLPTSHISPVFAVDGEMKPQLSSPVPPIPLPLKSSIPQLAPQFDSILSAQYSSHVPLLTPTQAHQKIAALEDAIFTQNPKETLLVPITRYGGTGIVRGWRVPGWVTYLLKGRQYGVGRAGEIVETGRSGGKIR